MGNNIDNSNQKNIIYAVYHDLSIEERSNEVFQALTKIPNSRVILNSLSEMPNNLLNKNTVFYSPRKPKYFTFLRLFKFWRLTKKLLSKYKPVAIILHDDAKLINYVLKKFPQTKIIYDQSELEIDRKITNLKTLFLKIVDMYGKNSIKYSNLFITANEERAEISKRYYQFTCKHVVFNNMHKINEEDIGIEYEDKYKYIFKEKSRVIVYGGGISKERGTFDLIDAIDKYEDIFLIIAGSCWNNLEVYKNKLRRDNISNVKYIGFVSRREWSYVLSKSMASFVYYDSNISLNFKYCASGKAYESLFIGVPLICSSNPPLISLCDEYECGVYSSNVKDSVDKLLSKYDYYKKNALKFKNLVDFDGRIPALAKSLEIEIFKSDD